MKLLRIIHASVLYEFEECASQLRRGTSGDEPTDDHTAAEIRIP